MLLSIILLLLFSKIESTQICFVLRTSTIRRDALKIDPGISQLDCNIRCINTPGCEGCMFYANHGRCTLFAPARFTPPGTCPAPYTLYEKTFSGCPAKARPPVDLNYVPGSCSRVSDITGPPRIAIAQPCGAPPVNQRQIVLDTLLHDGTRQNMDNHNVAFVDWDPYMGSWYYNARGRLAYFKCGTCVRAPSPPLPGCDCAPLPVNTVHIRTPSGTPVRIGSPPMCPFPQNVQLLFKRATAPNGEVEQWMGSIDRSVYCAMGGEWMCMMDQSGNYNEYAILAAMCVN